MNIYTGFDKAYLSTIKYDVYDRTHQAARFDIINPIANCINDVSCDYVRSNVYTNVERRINQPFIEDQIAHELSRS